MTYPTLPNGQSNRNQTNSTTFERQNCVTIFEWSKRRNFLFWNWSKKTSWFCFCFSLHCIVVWLKFVELSFTTLIVKWLFWLIHFYCSKNVFFFENSWISWISSSHYAHKRRFWFIDNKIELIILSNIRIFKYKFRNWIWSSFLIFWNIIRLIIFKSCFETLCDVIQCCVNVVFVFFVFEKKWSILECETIDFDIKNQTIFSRLIFFCFLIEQPNNYAKCWFLHTMHLRWLIDVLQLFV